MKRIEGESSRQKAYNKRKDKIIKKAQELTTLCETDLALLLFSPDGQLTSFGSNGRVEDTFIRFLELPDEYKRGPIQNAEQLALKLRELKKEAEMLEKIATIEALQEKLDKINRRTEEVREKLRFYNPDVEKINSVAEAELHQQFLVNALERIKLSKEKFFGEQTVGPDAESKEGKLLGEQIVQHDARIYEDKFLGKQIVQQDTESLKGKLLGEQIVPKETEIDEDKWLGERIVGQGTSRFERVADDMKCPVPTADQSANTIKRGRGRPRKNYSPHVNTHFSMDMIRAQKVGADMVSSVPQNRFEQENPFLEYKRVADDMKSPVPIADQSENTNKRRRGRPRKNRSPNVNTHLSMDLIRAQNLGTDMVASFPQG